MTENNGKQMMKLRDFRNAYGMPESTVRLLVNTKKFPAYLIGGRWYIDIPAFLKWREIENANNRKYP